MSNKNLDVMRLFEEELAKYRAYAEYLGLESDILSMSFQCLADNQSQDVARVFAVVAQNPAS